MVVRWGFRQRLRGAGGLSVTSLPAPAWSLRCSTHRRDNDEASASLDRWIGRARAHSVRKKAVAQKRISALATIPKMMNSNRKSARILAFHGKYVPIGPVSCMYPSTLNLPLPVARFRR